MDTIKTILVAALSGGLFTFIIFFVQRKDNKNDQLDKLEKAIAEIQEKLIIAEKDRIRTQMLIMMNHYPDDRIEIMKLAEHYFAVLHGDWYMTSIFNKWLEKNSIGKPEWFNPND